MTTFLHSTPRAMIRQHFSRRSRTNTRGPSSRRDLSGLMGRGLQSTEFHDLKVFFLYDWLASGKLTATGERSNWRGRHTLGLCRKRPIGTFAMKVPSL